MNFPYFSFFWLFVKICLVFKGFKFPKEIPICCSNVEGYAIIHQQKKTPPLYVIAIQLPQQRGRSIYQMTLERPLSVSPVTTDTDSLMQITLNRWGRSEDLRFHLLLFSQSFVNIKSSNKEDMICLCVLSVRGDLWRNFSACLRISWVYNILQPCLCVPGN